MNIRKRIKLKPKFVVKQIFFCCIESIDIINNTFSAILQDKTATENEDEITTIDCGNFVKSKLIVGKTFYWHIGCINNVGSGLSRVITVASKWTQAEIGTAEDNAKVYAEFFSNSRFK